jgi:hypothetical protein
MMKHWSGRKKKKAMRLMGIIHGRTLTGMHIIGKKMGGIIVSMFLSLFVSFIAGE